MADAEAICEAVTRANMRFVPIKTPEQQSGLVLHRTRHLFIRQQTSVINAIRAHLAEFGVTAPVGRHGVAQLLGIAADANDKRLPKVARACVTGLGAQLRMLKARILQFDRMITAWHRSSEASRRLDDIPGVGPALATALVASIGRSEGVPIRKGTSRPGSGSCRPKFDQNVRFFGCVSHQMRRIGIVPACNLNQPAPLPVLVQRLDYCETAVINEERVVAKYLPELRKRRVTVRDNLSVDLLQDRAQLFGT
jgi:hypothetical protein